MFPSLDHSSVECVTQELQFYWNQVFDDAELNQRHFQFDPFHR
jgi:hypothetical protein